MTKNPQWPARWFGFVALAAALNSFPIGLPAGMELWLGAYAYMPIVLTLPGASGFAAATIALAPTVWRCDHPFFLVLGVIEAVALLANRRFRRTDPVLADLVFWALIGAPAAFAFYTGLEDMPRDLATLMVGKLIFNQWTAVTLAHFVTRDTSLGDWLTHRPPHKVRIRELVFDHGLVLALIPLLIVGIGVSLVLHRLAEYADRDVLEGAAERIAQQLDLFLDAHEQAVTNTAAILARTSVDGDVVLEETRATHPAFTTLLAADRSGAIKHIAPAREGENLGPIAIPERRYFTIVHETNALHVSRVLGGKGREPDVWIAISAPLRSRAGDFDGIVMGAVDVHKFGQAAAQASAAPGVDLILADDRGRVIYAQGDTTLKPLARIGRDPVGPIASAENGRLVFDRFDAAGRTTRFVAFAVKSPRHPVMVIAQRPLLAGLRSAEWMYGLIAALMAGVVITAVLLARAASRRLSLPLENFALAAENQAARAMVEQIPVPNGPAPAETVQLFTAFNTLARKLQLSDEALRRHNAELDRRVADRTKELELARRMAEDANRSKGDFLAVTTHEIRTPLNAIIGLADVAIAEAPNGAVAERLRTISAAGSRLLTMLNDLLDVAKIDAGKLELVTEPIELGQLCRDVKALFDGRAKQHGIELRLECALPEPCWVTVDGGRLRQVLVNLLGNAVKFTARGTVRLEVKTIGTARGAFRVNFGVADTGPGISPAQQAKLFEPYAQVDQRQGKGTGLGLAISRRLVELLGGNLRLESRTGKGSTFSFTLTLKPSTKLTEPLPIAGSASGPAVLVADDNATNLEVIGALAAPLVQRLVSVASAADAIERLATHSFDVGLIDLEMPDADGFSVARVVRGWTGNEASKGCRLIAFSAYPREHMIARCREAGFDDFLAKPIDRKQLAKLLTTAVTAPGLRAVPRP